MVIFGTRGLVLHPTLTRPARGIRSDFWPGPKQRRVPVGLVQRDCDACDLWLRGPRPSLRWLDCRSVESRHRGLPYKEGWRASDWKRVNAVGQDPLTFPNPIREVLKVTRQQQHETHSASRGSGPNASNLSISCQKVSKSSQPPCTALYSVSFARAAVCSVFRGAVCIWLPRFRALHAADDGILQASHWLIGHQAIENRLSPPQPSLTVRQAAQETSHLVLTRRGLGINVVIINRRYTLNPTTVPWAVSNVSCRPKATSYRASGRETTQPHHIGRSPVACRTDWQGGMKSTRADKSRDHPPDMYMGGDWTVPSQDNRDVWKRMRNKMSL
jgi:hypothetical protein